MLRLSVVCLRAVVSILGPLSHCPLLCESVSGAIAVVVVGALAVVESSVWTLFTVAATVCRLFSLSISVTVVGVLAVAIPLFVLAFLRLVESA